MNKPTAINQITGTARDLTQQMRRETERTLTRSQAGIDVLLGRAEPDVGLTPKDAVYGRGTMRLYRYRPLVDEVYRVPVVFTMSLVSKPYILDLVPGQSFVEYLLKQGFDVFMIDWGVPRPQDRNLTLEDYVLDRMPRCMEEIQRITKEDEVSILGYCMGGLFGLMYSGAFPEAPVRNLVCVATPVDFTGMGLMRQWSDPRWFDVDKILSAYGNVPAEMIRTTLEMLRPLDRLLGYVRLWDNLWDEEYVYNWRVRYKWVMDQIPFPGATFKQLVTELMRGNKLMTGDFALAGRRINTKLIHASVLNAMAQYDHIAPFAATKPLCSLVGTEDRDEMVVSGGHVSLIAGRNAILRLWPTVNDWLSIRSV
jgi:polyhydroxyalkanoate synthase